MASLCYQMENYLNQGPAEDSNRLFASNEVAWLRRFIELRATDSSTETSHIAGVLTQPSVPHTSSQQVTEASITSSGASTMVADQRHEDLASPQSIYLPSTTVGTHSSTASADYGILATSRSQLSVDIPRLQIEAPPGLPTADVIRSNAAPKVQLPNDNDFHMHAYRLGVEDVFRRYMPEFYSQGTLENSAEPEIIFENGDGRNTANLLPNPYLRNTPSCDDVEIVHLSEAQPLWNEPVRKAFEYPDWTHHFQISGDLPQQILDTDFGE
ncbi:hypothetical protein RUND412_001354 [Rhizina undulata]